MITLEDQIRRYATDVAGPALGEPPADLGTVGHPRHRGRWVLVAALVVFIAGLTWVATRPSELGDRPSVDTVLTPTPSAASYPVGTARCANDGSDVGVVLAGPVGEGLCVAPDWQTLPFEPDIETMILRIYANGDGLGGQSISTCAQPPNEGLLLPSTAGSDTVTVIMVPVPPNTASARLGGGSGAELVPFDLAGVDGLRFVVAQAAPEQQHQPVLVLDDRGNPIQADWAAFGDGACVRQNVSRPHQNGN